MSTSLFEYSNIPDRKNRNKYTCCTRSKQITWFQKKLRSLLSWSRTFEPCKYDSSRAIFDVDYQVWNQSFLKLFQKLRFWCSSTSERIKKHYLSLAVRRYSQQANRMISKKVAKFIKLIKRFWYLQEWVKSSNIWRWLSGLKWELFEAFSKVEVLMFFDERMHKRTLLIHLLYSQQANHIISKKVAEFIKLIKRFWILQEWVKSSDIWRWLSGLKWELFEAFSKVEVLMFFDERTLKK
jgi:hypothetical protein